jgi:hypothetical protein
VPDVYSYNFPDDRRSLKFLGESSLTWLRFPVNYKALRPAYIVFLLETVQTALTGADIYHWFVIGYGNVKVLVDNQFSPIDGQIMSAPISLIVQGYYCYRIWTLQKRWWPLCLIIAVVRMFPFVG